MTLLFFRRVKQRVMAASMAVLGLMAIVPATTQANDEIESAMKSMKSAYRAAMSSSTIDEFAQYAEKLQRGADAARSQTYSDNPAVYREGMQKLQQQIQDMNQAIRNGDLSAAKATLTRMDATKKYYHDALDE